MSEHRNQLMTQPFNFVPTTLKEAQEYATIFATSGLCPEAYKGRPNDILIVWQMGKELGLDKMQSLRTLGCINGMPFAYGDGLLALIKRHSQFEDMHEWFEGSIEKGTLTAFCTMKRKGKEAVTQSFSMEDAKLANLWAKRGVWQLYPKRMLQHRARGFAAKDAFPDALYGLMSEEEAHAIQEMKPTQIKQTKYKGMSAVEESLGIAEEIVDAEVVIETKEEIIGEIIEEKNRLEELQELIIETMLTQANITVTLKKFGVAKMEDLTEDMINKWINHLKSKEKK